MKLLQFLILTGFFLLTTTPIAHSTTFTNEYCINATTLVTETTTDGSGVNVTTSYDFGNCNFGCDNATAGSQTCFLPAPEISYGLITTVAIGVLIFLFLALLKVFKEENNALRLLFLLLAFIFSYTLILSVGVLGQEYSGTIKYASNSVLGISTAYIWVIYFVVAYFLISFVANVLTGVAGGK